ncbi:MAG TPA: peptidase C45, partial [Dyadobacter sp.]|nr:peptidase C45 [Dyadobacter sp.]
ICYDLNNVFSNAKKFHAIDSLAVESDPFLNTADYRKYEAYKITRQRINKFVMLGIPYDLSADAEKEFIGNNPESYVTYMSLGNYFEARKQFQKAIAYYKRSLTYEVASENEKNIILDKIEACKKALAKV